MGGPDMMFAFSTQSSQSSPWTRETPLTSFSFGLLDCADLTEFRTIFEPEAFRYIAFGFSFGWGCSIMWLADPTLESARLDDPFLSSLSEANFWPLLFCACFFDALLRGLWSPPPRNLNCIWCDSLKVPALSKPKGLLSSSFLSKLMGLFFKFSKSSSFSKPTPSMFSSYQLSMLFAMSMHFCLYSMNWVFWNMAGGTSRFRFGLFPKYCR